MERTAVRMRILQQIDPERIGELGPGELMEVVAAIWSDVELAALMHGSRQFFAERLHHFTRRGYLTAREDQGTRRMLALSYRRYLLGFLRRTSGADPDDEIEPFPSTPLVVEGAGG